MRRSVWRSLVDLVPHGYTLSDTDWWKRHRLLLWVLALHVPVLAAFGLGLRRPTDAVLLAVAVPAACLLLGRLLGRYRRPASVSVTAGLVYSSAALVGLTGGTIEAHFHFFVIIGFIALYQDWIPFLFNVLFTVVSHGVGSAWQQSLIFNHTAGQGNPWLWSLIHGVAVLVACVGMALFWRVTEDSQREKDALQRRLSESEINRRQFASDMLVNLARRNQSMLYRQLEIINQLEESEQDPDALAELFKLDHLATRVQRNAESLLVLSGEQPARVWREAVPLRDVVRAAIAETEDLDRVSVLIDERPAIAGHSVTDVTHLLAELTENAVRFSPPDTVVRIRMRPDRRDPGGQLLVIEDWGVGMPPEELAAANRILAEAPDVDLAVSQRLGFHVVARLSARHGIGVSLSPTPGSGVTAVVALPAELFDRNPHLDAAAGAERSDAPASSARTPVAAGAAAPTRAREARFDADDTVPDWWTAADVVGGDGAAGVSGVGGGAAAPVVPAPRAATSAIAGDGATQQGGPPPATAEALGLRRRVPLTHLVPELRNPDPGDRVRAALPPTRPAALPLSQLHSGRPEALDGAAVPDPDSRPDAPAGTSAAEGAGSAVAGSWFEPTVPAPPEPGAGQR